MGPPTTKVSEPWTMTVNPSIPKPLYNLIVDNEAILKQVMRISSKELETIVKTYKDPKTLETMIRAMISRGFINTHTDSINLFQDNIGKAFEIGSNTGNRAPLPTQSIIKQTTIDSVMKYVTSLDNRLKTRAGEILAEGYTKQELQNVTVKRMVNELKMTEYQAKRIAITETMRSSNIASWSQNKAEGATHFIVDHRSTACKYCINYFSDRVYLIDEVRYLPPIHPHCACVPIFFYSEDEARVYQGRIQNRNSKELAKFEKQGFKIPKDGTGPIDTS